MHILIGFALEVADPEVPDGLCVRKSKTDQEGQGAEIAIPGGYRLRPVAGGAGVARRGRDQRRPSVPSGAEGQPRAGGTADAPQCRTDRQALRRTRWPRSSRYAGHSLRSGFLTSAAEAGASVFKMAEVSRHRSVDVLRGYVRRADLFREHAGVAFL
jgi:hypothetical protein